MNKAFKSIKKGLTEAIAQASGKPSKNKRHCRPARGLRNRVEKLPKTVLRISK